MEMPAALSTIIDPFNSVNTSNLTHYEWLWITNLLRLESDIFVFISWWFVMIEKWKSLIHNWQQLHYATVNGHLGNFLPSHSWDKQHCIGDKVLSNYWCKNCFNFLVKSMAKIFYGQRPNLHYVRVWSDCQKTSLRQKLMNDMPKCFLNVNIWKFSEQ